MGRDGVCDAGRYRAGIAQAWEHLRESSITAGLALGVQLLFGCVVALGLLGFDRWMGAKALTLQFIVGVGMVCAVGAPTSGPTLLAICKPG